MISLPSGVHVGWREPGASTRRRGSAAGVKSGLSASRESAEPFLKATVRPSGETAGNWW